MPAFATPAAHVFAAALDDAGARAEAGIAVLRVPQGYSLRWADRSEP